MVKVGSSGPWPSVGATKASLWPNTCCVDTWGWPTLCEVGPEVPSQLGLGLTKELPQPFSWASGVECGSGGGGYITSELPLHSPGEEGGTDEQVAGCEEAAKGVLANWGGQAGDDGGSLSPTLPASSEAAASVSMSNGVVYLELGVLPLPEFMDWGLEGLCPHAVLAQFPLSPKPGLGVGWGEPSVWSLLSRLCVRWTISWSKHGWFVSSPLNPSATGWQFGGYECCVLNNELCCWLSAACKEWWWDDWCELTVLLPLFLAPLIMEADLGFISACFCAAAHCSMQDEGGNTPLA